MGHFGPENEVSSELWICSKDFFKTFHNKGGQEIYENYINGFSKKNLIQGNWSILGPKITHCRNSGSAPTIFLKFCLIKRIKRYMKSMSLVFLKKVFRASGPFWVQKWHADISLYPLSWFFKNLALWKWSRSTWKLY